MAEAVTNQTNWQHIGIKSRAKRQTFWHDAANHWLLRRFADSGNTFPDEDGAILLVKPREVGDLMRISLLHQQMVDDLKSETVLTSRLRHGAQRWDT